MTTVHEGEELLRRTEVDLRRLLGEAAAAGDYESVMALTRWASQVALLISRREDVPSNAGDDRAEEERGEVARRASGVRRTGKRPQNRAKQKGKGRGKASSSYPRFLRRGEEIVKIGWSKRSKTEYQHKAPHRVVSLLTAAIAQRGTKESLVAASDLMPLKDPSDGAEIPDYQVYVCLAWLRHEGLIEQEGRQGYRVPDTSSLEKLSNDRWEAVLSK